MKKIENNKVRKSDYPVYIFCGLINLAFLYVIARYLKMGTPNYVHPDEPIVTSRILSMLQN